MKRELSIEFSRVTEAAALAGYKWIGRGNKNAADQAAVEAMRNMLNTIDMTGEITIGEGEIDEAPMLYIGEKVGRGTGDKIDIAIDPIEGTRITAMGQLNAISVLAAGEKGVFLQAPDMYMEKIVVGPKAKNSINLSKSLIENIHSVCDALNKSIEQFTMVTLAKPRHQDLIEQIQKMGAKVFAYPDGDVAASILTSIPSHDVDMMYCIGGAPEGIISAAVIRALGGEMQAKLLTRDTVKGDSINNIDLAKTEIKRCKTMGVTPNEILSHNDLVKSDNIIFSATGLTKGDLLNGVYISKNIAKTETLVIRGSSKTIRKIISTHDLTKKSLW